MSDKVNPNAIDEDAFDRRALDEAAERFDFVLGKSEPKARMRAIQNWLGGQAQLSKKIKLGTLKSWASRGSIPREAGLVALTEGSGLSSDYVTTGAVKNLADLAVEEHRFNQAKSASMSTGLGPLRQDSRRRVINMARASIDSMREQLLGGSALQLTEHEPPRAEPVALPAGYVALAPLLPEDMGAAGSHIYRFAPSPMAVARSWLADFGLEPDDCRFCLASDESMFSVGALLFIDRREQGVRNGGIYMVSMGGELVPRRVARRLDGAFEFFADRGSYPREVVDAGQLQGLVIGGRVFWVGAAV